MNIQQGDIFQNKEGLILSQVNCQGAHGSGLAATINQLYPQVKDEYTLHCLSGRHPLELLGDFLLVQVSDTLAIGCCFGQLHYGRGPSRYTNYGALAKAFVEAQRVSWAWGRIHIPHLIGCGLAKGDPVVVSELIDFLLPGAIVWQHNP